jgi:glycosyltransferase involved in cell wall biosynthesis
MLVKEFTLNWGLVLKVNKKITDKKLKQSYYEKLKQKVQESNASKYETRELKKILLYTHGLPGGGAERQWINLLENLLHEGYEVKLVVNNLYNENNFLTEIMESRMDENLIDLSTINNIDVIENLGRYESIGVFLNENSYKENLNLSRLLYVLETYMPDLVISQMDTLNITAGIASTLYGKCKLILSARALSPNNYPYLFNEYFLESYRILLENPNVELVANSKAAALSYEKWLNLIPGCIKVVKNDYILKLRELETKDISGNRYIRGFFRLSPEKEPLRFLNIAEIILSLDYGYYFEIYGEGPLKLEIENEIKKRDLNKKVTIMKPVVNPIELMFKSHIILHPASKEGSSNTIAEAKILQKFIVCDDAGDNYSQLSGYNKLIKMNGLSDNEIAHEIVQIQDEFEPEHDFLSNVEDSKNYKNYSRIYESLRESNRTKYFEDKALLKNLDEQNDLGFKKSNEFMKKIKIIIVSIYIFIFYIVFFLTRKTPRIRDYAKLKIIRKFAKFFKYVKSKILSLKLRSESHLSWNWKMLGGKNDRE